MTTVRGELGQYDILITAPYNMQVNRLQKRIGHKARIGTVDKFQGQEAPVAIHSLTASDGDSAPRGLDFLLDPNRLNVAISRAQCLSIVVGSPQLATGISNSIGNVQRLNRLCSLMAAQLPADGQEGGRVTRFIHTADWQIGKPYRQIADEQKRFKLQQERLNAIGRIRDAARMQAAAFVVVAGDLFDSPTPPTTAVLEVLEAIGEMEIPVLVIPGNHDHGALGTVWHREDFQRHQRQMAPNLRLLLEREPVELDQAVLLPCPLLRNQDSADPTLWLRSLDWSGLDAAKPRIVLAHGGVHGFGGREYGLDDEAQAGANNLIDLTSPRAGDRLRRPW